MTTKQQRDRDAALSDELRRALEVPVAPADHEALMRAFDEAEPQTGRRFLRGASTKMLLVVAGVTLSGAVVAAAAVPAAVGLLFPPAVPTSFTFQSGVTCSVDIRVTPDFATSKHPQAAVGAAQEFLEHLDVSSLPIERASRGAGEGSPAARAAQAARDALADSTDSTDSTDSGDSGDAGESPDSADSPTTGTAAESEAVSSAVVDAIWAELDRQGYRGGVSIESRAVCE